MSPTHNSTHRSAKARTAKRRDRSQYAAAGAVPVALAAGQDPAQPVLPNTGHSPIVEAINYVFHLPMPVLAGGAALVGGGYMAYTKVMADGGLAKTADGFATKRQLNKLLSAKALKKNRRFLQPQLANVRGRHVDPRRLGFELGKVIDRRHTAWIPYEQPMLVLAPSRAGKTRFLGNIILDAPGAAVVTSTKYDVVSLTQQLRGRLGPIELLNADGLGGVPSSLRWDLVRGCHDPAVALRRAENLLQGSDATAGVENRNFWETKAFAVLKSLLWAAAVDERTLMDVALWSKDPKAKTASEIIKAHESIAPAGWLEDLAQLQEIEGKATTTESVFHTLSSTFQFLYDPKMAQLVTSGTGASFDFRSFIAAQGTLYMLGEARKYGVAAFYAALMAELYHAGKDMASYTPGERLDPFVTLALDEAARICPIPLEDWSAVAGGLGFSLWAVAQSRAQLESRWGHTGADIIWDNTTQLVLPGLKVMRVLRELSDLCGMRDKVVETVTTNAKGEQSTSRSKVREPVMAPDEIKGMDPLTGLLIGKFKPVRIQYTAVDERKDVRELEAARRKKERAVVRARRVAKVRGAVARVTGRTAPVVIPQDTPGWQQPAYPPAAPAWVPQQPAAASAPEWEWEPGVYDTPVYSVPSYNTPAPQPAAPADNPWWAAQAPQQAAPAAPAMPAQPVPAPPSHAPTVHLPTVPPAAPAASARLDSLFAEEEWAEEDVI